MGILYNTYALLQILQESPMMTVGDKVKYLNATLKLEGCIKELCDSARRRIQNEVRIRQGERP